MKIVISSTGSDLSSPVDERFGRAKGFVIFDTESNTFEFADNNQVLNTPSGAGIQAAKHVTDLNADILLTGHCGPKAFRALNAAEVKIFIGIKGTVQDALDAFNNNQLELASGADVEGHWA